MNTANIIILIGNSILILLAVIGMCMDFYKEKTKLCKKNGELEAMNVKLMTDNAELNNNHQEYIKKFPIKSKYKPGETVFGINNDIVYHGYIKSVIARDDKTFSYEICYRENASITIKEENVYLEKIKVEHKQPKTT